MYPVDEFYHWQPPTSTSDFLAEWSYEREVTLSHYMYKSEFQLYLVAINPFPAKGFPIDV